MQLKYTACVCQRYRLIHLISQLWMNSSCLFHFRIYSETDYFYSRFSSVLIVTRPRTGRPGILLRFSGRDLFLVQRVQTVSGSHTASYFVGTKGQFPGDTNSRLLKQTNLLDLQSRLRMSGAIPTFPPLPARLTYGQFQSLLLYTYTFCRTLWTDFQTSTCVKSLYLFLYDFITTLLVVQSVSSVVQYMAKRPPIRIHTCTC